MAAGTCSPCWRAGSWALDPQQPARVLVSSGGTASAEAATALNMAVSAPVAELRRVFCAPDGTVIYLGELTYRGDFIRVDRGLLARQAAPHRAAKACASCGHAEFTLAALSRDAPHGSKQPLINARSVVPVGAP